MLRKHNRVFLGLALFLALASSASAAPVHSYAVKFVCGYNPTNIGWSLNGNNEGEQSVKFGNYATEINLVNANSIPVDIRKHVILLVKEGFPIGREPKVQGLAAVDGISLKSFEGTMDDCNRIWELLSGGGPAPNPFPLTIGWLVIRSTAEIDVTAVYTAQTCANWVNSPDKLDCLDPNGRFTDASVSIDVEQISGREAF